MNFRFPLLERAHQLRAAAGWAVAAVRAVLLRGGGTRRRRRGRPRRVRAADTQVLLADGGGEPRANVRGWTSGGWTRPRSLPCQQTGTLIHRADRNPSIELRLTRRRGRLHRLRLTRRRGRLHRLRLTRRRGRLHRLLLRQDLVRVHRRLERAHCIVCSTAPASHVTEPPTSSKSRIRLIPLHADHNLVFDGDAAPDQTRVAALRYDGHCPGRKPPKRAVKRLVRPYKKLHTKWNFIEKR